MIFVLDCLGSMCIAIGMMSIKLLVTYSFPGLMIWLHADDNINDHTVHRSGNCRAALVGGLAVPPLSDQLHHLV